MCKKNEQAKRETVYFAMKDIYKEFNRSVNHLVILREFLNDVCMLSEGEKKEQEFYYPSVEKTKRKQQ
jgi:hypothetical protein